MSMDAVTDLIQTISHKLMRHSTRIDPLHRVSAGTELILCWIFLLPGIVTDSSQVFRVIHCDAVNIY